MRRFLSFFVLLPFVVSIACGEGPTLTSMALPSSDDAPLSRKSSSRWIIEDSRLRAEINLHGGGVLERLTNKHTGAQYMWGHGYSFLGNVNGLEDSAENGVYQYAENHGSSRVVADTGDYFELEVEGEMKTGAGQGTGIFFFRSYGYQRESGRFRVVNRVRFGGSFDVHHLSATLDVLGVAPSFVDHYAWQPSRMWVGCCASYAQQSGGLRTGRITRLSNRNTGRMVVTSRASLDRNWADIFDAGGRGGIARVFDDPRQYASITFFTNGAPGPADPRTLEAHFINRDARYVEGRGYTPLRVSPGQVMEAREWLYVHDGTFHDFLATLGGAPPASGGACNPSSQPSPDWGERDGQCLRSCGQLAPVGARCEASGCPTGFVEAGLAYDCPVCCQPTDTGTPPPPTGGTCNPSTQPFPDWGERDGQCLRSCGQLAPIGARCEASGCPSGFVEAGRSYDCPVCCQPASADTPPSTTGGSCNPSTQPSPDWGERDGQCLRSCGQLAPVGARCEVSGCSSGFVEAGRSYDCPVCCQPADIGTPPPPTAGSCNPSTQPSPDWGERDGQCLRSCGQLAPVGARCEVSACAPGYIEAGRAYDCPVCCEPLPNAGGVCDPATQPFPDWGERDGRCLRSCGQLGAGRPVSCELSGCPPGYAPTANGPAYDCPVCCVN